MDQAAAEEFLHRYNACFYDRDLEALRAMYVDDGQVVYFDNHPDCDSPDLGDHLGRVGPFLAHGDIVPLSHEALRVFGHGDAACLIAIIRYANRPRPGVRASFFLERHQGDWKIRHIHFSTDPNEAIQESE